MRQDYANCIHNVPSALYIHILVSHSNATRSKPSVRPDQELANTYPDLYPRPAIPQNMQHALALSMTVTTSPSMTSPALFPAIVIQSPERPLAHHRIVHYCLHKKAVMVERIFGPAGPSGSSEAFLITRSWNHRSTQIRILTDACRLCQQVIPWRSQICVPYIPLS